MSVDAWSRALACDHGVPGQTPLHSGPPPSLTYIGEIVSPGTGLTGTPTITSQGDVRWDYNTPIAISVRGCVCARARLL